MDENIINEFIMENNCRKQLYLEEGFLQKINKKKLWLS